MYRFAQRVGLLIVVGMIVMVCGCETDGGKRLGKRVHQEFSEVERIAKVGVTPEIYEKAFKKAEPFAKEAIGKLGEGDMQTAIQELLDAYTDAMKVVVKTGELDSQVSPFGELKNKYALRVPSRYYPQFALLQKIFDRGKSKLKGLKQLVDQ